MKINNDSIINMVETKDFINHHVNFLLNIIFYKSKINLENYFKYLFNKLNPENKISILTIAFYGRGNNESS